MWVATRAATAGEMLSIGGIAAVSLVGVAAVDSPCETQTAYYCLSVVEDPNLDSGRTLVLDDLRHSYVDLDDPTRPRVLVHPPDRRRDRGARGDVGRTDRRGLSRRWSVHRAALRACDPPGQRPDDSRDRRRPRRRGRGADRLRPRRRCRDHRRRRPPRRWTISPTIRPTSSSATRSGAGRFRSTWRPRSSSPRSTGCCGPTGSTWRTSSTAPHERFLRAEAATIAEVFEHVAVIRGPGIVQRPQRQLRGRREPVTAERGVTRSTPGRRPRPGDDPAEIPIPTVSWARC